MGQVFLEHFFHHRRKMVTGSTCKLQLTKLTSFIDETTRSADQGRATGVIYLDRSKAFYAVSLSILGVLSWDALVWVNVCLRG